MVIGINFRTAPAAVRERFWISESRQKQTLTYLAEAEGIEEAVVLVSCERTEFLIWANDAALAANSVLRLLSSEYSLQLCQWEHFYRLLNEDALAHLFRVASGLDSVISGDARGSAISLKEAWLRSQKDCCSAKCLDRVLHKSLEVSERIPNQPSGLSVASIAVDTAKQKFGSLEHRTVVVIGAGALGELTASCVANQGDLSLRILNRTFERALQLSEKIGGTAVPFEDLVHQLTSADVVISCAAANEPILREDLISHVARERKGRNLCVIDLGMPRNVDPTTRQIPDVFLYTLDDIQKAVAHPPRTREPALLAAEYVVDAEARNFFHNLAGEHIVPMTLALRERLDQLCRVELQLLRKERGPFPKDQDQTLTAFASRITHRLAASLVHELKEVPEKVEQEHMTDAVQRLFHLEPEKELIESKKNPGETLVGNSPQGHRSY
ncbi:MAG TPA: glutamyl-tRNA reductase [Terriglobales bacterium]